MDSISYLGAIGIHMMDSLGVRYVDACSNDLLVVMTDAAPICVSDLLPVRFFEGQMRAPEQHLARTTEQHVGLKHALAQQCHKVSLHTILLGMMGTTYNVILSYPSEILA